MFLSIWWLVGRVPFTFSRWRGMESYLLFVIRETKQISKKKKRKKKGKNNKKSLGYFSFHLDFSWLFFCIISKSLIPHFIKRNHHERTLYLLGSFSKPRCFVQPRALSFYLLFFHLGTYLLCAGISSTCYVCQGVAGVREYVNKKIMTQWLHITSLSTVISINSFFLIICVYIPCIHTHCNT